MKYWVVEQADGKLSQHITNGADPKAEGIDTGKRISEAPREGAPDEVFDWKLKQWVKDMSLAAKLEYQKQEFLLTPEAKMMLHARKAVEAYGYERGLPTPLLSAEAKAVGMTLAELVKLVLTNDEAVIESEIQRRLAKAQLTSILTK